MSTEDALRDALDQAQQVEKLMEAMRSCPDKSQVSHTGQGWADRAASCGALAVLGQHGPVLGTLVRTGRFSPVLWESQPKGVCGLILRGSD